MKFNNSDQLKRFKQNKLNCQFVCCAQSVQFSSVHFCHDVHILMQPRKAVMNWSEAAYTLHTSNKSRRTQCHHPYLSVNTLLTAILSRVSDVINVNDTVN